MKYTEPSASGFKKPPNEFDTLQFDESDAPPPFCRYFCPDQRAFDMLKAAKYFGRITMREPIREQEMCKLLYQSHLPISPWSVTYAGQMILVYSSDEQVR